MIKIVASYQRLISSLVHFEHSDFFTYTFFWLCLRCLYPGPIAKLSTQQAKRLRDWVGVVIVAGLKTCFPNISWINVSRNVYRLSNSLPLTTLLKLSTDSNQNQNCFQQLTICNCYGLCQVSSSFQRESAFLFLILWWTLPYADLEYQSHLLWSRKSCRPLVSSSHLLSQNALHSLYSITEHFVNQTTWATYEFNCKPLLLQEDQLLPSLSLVFFMAGGRVSFQRSTNGDIFLKELLCIWNQCVISVHSYVYSLQLASQCFITINNFHN